MIFITNLFFCIANFVIINMFMKKNDLQAHIANHLNTLPTNKEQYIFKLFTWSYISILKKIPNFNHIRFKIAKLLDFFNYQNINILDISNFVFYKLFCTKKIFKDNNTQFIYKQVTLIFPIIQSHSIYLADKNKF